MINALHREIIYRHFDAINMSIGNDIRTGVLISFPWASVQIPIKNIRLWSYIS